MSGELRKYRALALALIATVLVAVLLFAQFLKIDLDRNRERLAAQVAHAAVGGAAHARYLLGRLETLARLRLGSDVSDARLRALIESDDLAASVAAACLHEAGAVRALYESDAAPAAARCAATAPAGTVSAASGPGRLLAVAATDRDASPAGGLRIVRRGDGPSWLEVRMGDGRDRAVVVTIPAERLLDPFALAATGDDAPLAELCLSLRVGARFRELACRDNGEPAAPEALVHPMPRDASTRLIGEAEADGLRWRLAAAPDYRALSRRVPLLPFAVLGLALAIGAAVCAFAYSAVGRSLELEARARELRALLGRLEERNRQNEKLDQFAAMAAHDLQAPIRFVVSGAHTLNMELEELGRPDLTAMGETLIEQGERMRALILDLLEFCRAGQTELALEPVDARTVVDDEIGLLRGRPEYADTLFCVGHLPSAVLCDASKFSQIVRNLVGNAAKFSRGASAPKVTVCACRRDDGWVFSVEDNGPGIRAEHRERIFLPFNRLDRDTEGSGMGLAIVKKLVERHGGTIRAGPARRSAGTAFRFTLPDATPEDDS